MALKTIPVEITDLEDPDKMLYLVQEDGEAHVTIVRAISYNASRVKLHKITKGDFGGVGKDGQIDVPNDNLHVVVEEAISA